VVAFWGVWRRDAILLPCSLDSSLEL
jgi:hypothetical protein